MRQVIVVCEGQTEEAFVSRLLTPAFLPLDLHIRGITVQTSPGHKGGALSYDRLLPAVRNALASGRVAAVTTLIDLYRLDTGFPGFGTAAALLGLEARLDALERSLHADVVVRSGCAAARFIPHIQPHRQCPAGARFRIASSSFQPPMRSLGHRLDLAHRHDNANVCAGHLGCENGTHVIR